MMSINNFEGTVFYFVRHGETDWNLQGRFQGREDIELNQTGLEQANRLAAYFKTIDCSIVVTSPLKRAYKTAEIIAGQTELEPVQILEQLIERDYGAGSGLTQSQHQELYPNGIPGLEAIDDLRQRAKMVFNRLTHLYAGHRAIIVSHGGILNSVLYNLSSGEYGHKDTLLGNGSICKIICKDNNWEIEYLNKTM